MAQVSLPGDQYFHFKMCRAWNLRLLLHFPKIHRSVLRKITIDQLYFWDVYDVNPWERKFGRSTTAEQISLYNFIVIRKKIAVGEGS